MAAPADTLALLEAVRRYADHVALRSKGDDGTWQEWTFADYLDRWQPPSLMLWGRHDAFFDLAETLSWMEALPRMEVHVLDAGHFLLETHAAVVGSLMVDFVARTHPEGPPPRP